MEQIRLNVSKSQAEAAWQEWQERQRRYNEYGWDRQASLDFIMEVSTPIEGNVLEIGAGKGGMTRALLDHGSTVTAVDTSMEALRDNIFITSHYGQQDHVSYFLADASSLDFPSASFDLVVGCYVLHHLESPDPVLDECVRLLSPHGRIMLADFSSEGFKLLDKIHRLEGNGSHPVPEESGVQRARDYLRTHGFRTQRMGETLVEAVIASREF